MLLFIHFQDWDFPNGSESEAESEPEEWTLEIPNQGFFHSFGDYFLREESDDILAPDSDVEDNHCGPGQSFFLCFPTDV